MKFLLFGIACASFLLGCNNLQQSQPLAPISQQTGAQPENVAKTASSADTCHGMTLGQNTSLNGLIPFLASDLWNTDISAAPVDPNSASYLSFIGTSSKLHPDFGSGSGSGGIPYQIVGEDTVPTPMVNVTYNQTGGESDPGIMPIPANPVIEPPTDSHLLVLDRHNCFLYELFGAAVDSSGNVSAGSGAVFDLRRNSPRPYAWTSADAAGLSVFAGLARYDEVAAGAINHALRFTVARSQAEFTPPARHYAANSSAQFAAPMGMRLRLKASFDISGFTPQAQVILTALKKYGMIVADNGSNMFITGAPNDGWNNDDLHTLTRVTAANFDVIAMPAIYTNANIPSGHAPAITAFTGTKNADHTTTLTWTAANASTTFFVSPGIGAVRGYNTVVAPAQTTTYTLYATNDYSRVTATYTLTVGGPLATPVQPFNPQAFVESPATSSAAASLDDSAQEHPGPAAATHSGQPSRVPE